MKELWIDRERLKEASGWSDHFIRERVRDGTLAKRYKKERSPNGRQLVEYNTAGLPTGVKMKLHELQRRDSTTLAPPAQSDLLDLQVSLPFVPSGVDGVPDVIPPGKEPEAERRYRLIKPLLEWKDKKPQFLDDDGTPFRSKDQLAEWIARHSDPTHRASRATLLRLVKRWEKGLPGLVRKGRRDKGRSRYFDRFPEAAGFVLSKYKEGKGEFSDVLIWEILVREWPTLYPSKLKPPSIDTVRNFLQRVEPALRDAVRLPRQQHDQKHAPYLLTDIEAVPANGIWVSDHRIYDVLVYNDCFEGAERGAAIRLWETCIMDMRTRVVVGSVWNVNPSSSTIADALFRAISKYGKPELFYCDNGKDFRKIGGGRARPAEDLDENGAVRIAPATEGLLNRLGIQVKYCIPRHPQSKLIESYFSTVSRRFDVMFGDSYTGRDPKRRPDSCREAEKQHRLWLEEKCDSSPFTAASSFVTLHRQWTEEFNTAHKHSGRGMEKRSPYEVMNELMPPEERIIPDMVELAPLFWDGIDRVVANCKVERDGIEYEASDEAGAAAMYLANGTKVSVARNPEDVGRALAINQEGQVIACLQSKKLAARGPQSEEAIKHMMRLRGRLSKATKGFWKKFAELGVPTEVQLLAKRAGALPPDIDSSRPAANRLALGAAVDDPSSRPLYTEDAVDRARAAMRGSVGAASSSPRYIEDVVDRARAAMRASESNSSIHCAEDTVEELLKEVK